VQRWRYVAASGIVVVLAGTLAFAVLRDPAPAPELAPPSTSTTLPTTTTTLDRTEEVRLILEDLYFRWFDAIYRKDPDALWEVVATQEGHADGVRAMETMKFFASPRSSDVKVSGVELLRDSRNCLVAYSTVDITAFRGEGAVRTGVDVLWPADIAEWRFASAWTYKDDLWESDCDLRTRESTP